VNIFVVRNRNIEKPCAIANVSCEPKVCLRIKICPTSVLLASFAKVVFVEAFLGESAARIGQEETIWAELQLTN
jgi:hypothetical protein